MNAEAQKIIARLGLAPLPHEGGFFRQTWLSKERLANGRATGSAILFLLTPADFSALHRLETDEIWHFCAGDPVEHVQLHSHDGSAQLTRLGPDAWTDTLQLVVPGGAWQGARLALSHAEGLALSSADEFAPGEPGMAASRLPRTPSRGWALLGCTMAPAWEEKEFTLGRQEELIRYFPAQAALIRALSR
jgi:predicted cupin superfamily sugar epimerase